MKKLIVAALLAAGARQVLADPYDETILLRHKDWTVRHTFSASDGQQWCVAETTDRKGTAMSVVGYDSGKFAFTLYNPRWRMPEDSERFLTVDVDYERFDGWATGSGTMLFLALSGEVGIEFLVHLRNGRAVAVYNDEMRRINAFSLSGSAAAIAKLAECYDRIRLPDERDPYIGAGASSSDPFL